MFYDEFSRLCKERGISVTKATEEIGLARTIGTKWKKTGATPNGETLAKIAEYFETTVGELLGIEKEPVAVSNELSEEEIQFIKWYRNQASEKDKAIVRAIINADD